MRMSLYIASLTAALAFVPARAADSSPGLLVRLYDIGVDVAWLPELAPDQLPNVVKVVPTLDLRLERKDFGGLESQFMTEVTGQVKIEKAGAYRFRLLSDDGAKLWLDSKLVIDHDGLHGAEPKDSEPVELTAGPHELRVLHFQGGGGAQVTLMWAATERRSDGATKGAEPEAAVRGQAGTFEVVPAAVLSHPADASMQTAPGTKKIIPPLRRGRPGDGTLAAGLHPGFTQEREGARIDGKVMLKGAYVRATRGMTGSDARIVIWVPERSDTSGDSPVFDLPSSPYGAQKQTFSDTGELKRIFFDQEGRLRQGCAFRLSLGDPDWPMNLATKMVAFEMLAVRAMSNGFEIEFTKPLDKRVGWEAESYCVEQWPFDLVKGQAPRRDGVIYPVKSASVSPNRKQVLLEIPGLKTSHVVYLRLLPPCVSEDGELPWSTEAWYTLNAIPTDRAGKVLPPPAKEPQNVLTEEEKQQGFRLLFDGQTTKGWHGYQRKGFPDGWKVVDGCLCRVGPGGDIVTDEEFGDFELRIDWRISQGGNSGIMYRVAEDKGAPFETGPEYQILDNAEHGDGRNPLTSAASCYALYAPVRDVTAPVGLFNQARIIVRGNHVEHWLNDVKVVEYEIGSAQWQKLVAESKFGSMPGFGRQARGRIDLQDHGDRVWYRNIRIRELMEAQ